MTPYYEQDGITIYHGDCLEHLSWLSADVLITDPPYGMSFVSSRTNEKRPIANDNDCAARDAVLELWGARPAAVFGSWKVTRPARYITNRLIWDKSDGTGPGMGDLSQSFGNSDEEIYLFGEWPKRDKRRANVIRTHMSLCGLVTKIGHPTPKPVELMSLLMRCAPDGVVADPFCGSGSTLLAAKLHGRHAIGIEIEERYCEIAAKRLSQGVLPLTEAAS